MLYEPIAPDTWKLTLPPMKMATADTAVKDARREMYAGKVPFPLRKVL